MSESADTLVNRTTHRIYCGWALVALASTVCIASYATTLDPTSALLVVAKPRPLPPPRLVRGPRWRRPAGGTFLCVIDLLELKNTSFLDKFLERTIWW